MAKRRLNKKVALTGSAVILVLAVILILAILHMSRNPKKFVRDGDAALQTALMTTDEQIKIKEYKRAERNYHKARARTKDDSLKIEVLFKLVDMYTQLDMHTESDQWRYVLGCWNQIVMTDSKNIKARYGRLKYFYIMANNGVNQLWQEIRDQASELVDLAKSENLLTENPSKWKTAGMPEVEINELQLGPYLYLIRGRANLELARLGSGIDPDKLLAQATDDFEKVLEFDTDKDKVDAYWYLARVALQKGEILAKRGNLEEREKSVQRAIELLEQAVKNVPTQPKAHINLLTMKLAEARTLGKEKIQELEPEYLSLVNKFPSSAEAFAALSRYYSDYHLNPKNNIDKATNAAEEAVKLDRENVIYAIYTANLYYRKFCYYNQNEELYKAIELAKNALALPNAQERSGPRNWANKMNKSALYAFLANCYIEQILEPCEERTESETAVWLKNAEQAVHEIEQIFGSGEDPQVIKWRGMLELAKGNEDIAIRKLYAAYEHYKASGKTDMQISYLLAKVFSNTSEVGAVVEFLINALNSNIALIKPDARLDYVDILLKLKLWTIAISNINAYEEIYGHKERSQKLRITAYIGAKQFDEAEEELAKLKQDDPNAIKLRLALAQSRIEQLQGSLLRKQMQERQDAIFQPNKTEEKEIIEIEASEQLITKELTKYEQLALELTKKLLSIEQNYAEQSAVIYLCGHYISRGQINKAKDLVNQYLQYFPDNPDVLVYKKIISEPEPEKTSYQRQYEIKEEVFSNMNDPILRAASLGVLYQRNNQPDKAASELKKVIKANLPKGTTYNLPFFGQIDEVDLQLLAADYLFEIAVEADDWEFAEQIVETVQIKNLDKCKGQVFAARLSMAKGNPKDALEKLNESLKQRPIYSRAYMFRSRVHSVLGNEHASIADIRQAATLNPLDGTIAKVLAVTLFERNQKLGDNVSSEQLIDARTALDRALALNPNDFQLLDFYADYIGQTEPLRALAIRQNIQTYAPSVRNSTRIGQLATKLAIEETDPKRKEAFFTIAGSSFEQAKKINPHDKEMLNSYAGYYYEIGRDDMAQQLLQESEDQGLLWSHYYQQGQFEKAKNILEQLYEINPKDSNILKGLVLIAAKTADKEASKKYSEELVSIESNAENHLVQIQTFLKIGLVKEAEHLLQSFKEKYPDESRVVLLEAWLAMRQGQLEKALTLANRNLESNQEDAVAWRLRGEINLFMANYDQAISDLNKSKQLSDETDTRLSLAKCYLKMGRMDDAIIELKNMIDIPGASIEGRILLEQTYIKLGRKDTLRKLYEDTLEKFPNNALWYNRAGALFLSDSNFNKAEQLYTKAYTLKRQEYPELSKLETVDEEYAMALDGYLQTHVLAAGSPDAKDGIWNPGKLDIVIEEGGKYIHGVYAPIAYLRMAEAKMKMGDKNTAINYCRKAVDNAGTNETLASDILLRMFLLLGPEEVSKYCKQKIQGDPDSLPANWTMFNLSKINDEYDEAVGYLDKCIEIAGSDTLRGANYTVNKAEILTLAYEKTSDNNYLKQAIAVYESLLVKMPNNTSVLNNLAYMLAQSNERLSDALEYAKKAVEASPNKADFLDTYGYVLYKNGQISKAAEFLAAASQQYEQDEILAPAEVYEHIGMVKEELGAKDQALASYKQALEIGADKLSKKANKRIRTAIERLSQ